MKMGNWWKGKLEVSRAVFSNPQAVPEDPLDVLVLCQESVVPLTVMKARAIGLMTILDTGKFEPSAGTTATATLKCL